MSMLIGKFAEYRGYTGTIEYDYEHGIYYGKILNIKELLTYKADTVEKLYEEYKRTIDNYKDMRKEK